MGIPVEYGSELEGKGRFADHSNWEFLCPEHGDGEGEQFETRVAAFGALGVIAGGDVAGGFVDDKPCVGGHAVVAPVYAEAYGEETAVFVEGNAVGDELVDADFK